MSQIANQMVTHSQYSWPDQIRADDPRNTPKEIATSLIASEGSQVKRFSNQYSLVSTWQNQVFSTSSIASLVVCKNSTILQSNSLVFSYVLAYGKARFSFTLQCECKILTLLSKCCAGGLSTRLELDAFPVVVLTGVLFCWNFFSYKSTNEKRITPKDTPMSAEHTSG